LLQILVIVVKSLINNKWLSRLLLLSLLMGFSLYSHSALAAEDIGLADVAKNITNGLENLANLITAASFVMGFGFAAAAILKFKAHKDNPAQIPIGTPIALLFIAAALIYLPSMYGAIGETVFGLDRTAGNAHGWSDPEHPGKS
jgi:intracellular multiplication protein IcmD